MAKVFKECRFDNFTVRTATTKDTEAVIQLLRGAASWLDEKGISQWSYLQNGGEDHEIKEGIAAGTTYVVENSDDNLVATFNFSSDQNEWDVGMWGERDDLAYYIHRLAVHKDHHHNQIGRKILAWIDRNIQLQNGHVRLDCVASNQVLNDFYRSLGYRFVGHIGEGQDIFSLYEKDFQG